MVVEVIKEQEVMGKDFKVYGDFENPLFLAKDVAEWLEHSNPRVMLDSVDDDEKVVNNVYTLGGNQNAWFLTENGLYEVLMLSRKPIAKQFKKEVKKILHEIRTTGGYTVPKTFREALELALNQQKQIEELKPKADTYDSYMDRGGYCNFRDASNICKVSQKEFMDLLKSKYIYKNSVGDYRCYADYSELFILRPFTAGDKTRQQLLLTVAGLNYFGRVLSDAHAERRKQIIDSAMEATRTLMQGMKPCFGMCAG